MRRSVHFLFGDPAYIIKECTINFYDIKAGSIEFIRDDLYLHRQPNFLGIAMSENGSKDFERSQVFVYKDGVQHFDLPSRKYRKPYWGLVQCADVPVTYKQFKKGMLVYGFQKERLKKKRRMNTCIRIKLKFQEPLAQDVKLVIYRDVDHFK